MKAIHTYISNRLFRVKDVETYSGYYPILAGYHREVYLTPLLYTLYTADTPVLKISFIGTFADDAAIMKTYKLQPEAVKNLRKTLNKLNY